MNKAMLWAAPFSFVCATVPNISAAAARTVTITAPTNGTAVASPVTVTANVDAKTCNSGLNHLQVLVNGILAYQGGGSCAIAAPVGVSHGSDALNVQAIAWNGALMAQSTVTVSVGQQSGGPQLYVATAGSDSNPGTAQLPFRTILKASQVATPGTTVNIAPGSYPGGFQTAANGTASARIRYFSTTRYGAKIVPPANSTSDIAWDNRGSYVTIDGFEVDGTYAQSGTQWAIGVYAAGSYGVVENNLVHNIAQNAGCTDHGGAGILTDNYYGGVYDDVIANIVHDIGPVGCNYDQGIYISTSGKVENNLAYNIAWVAIHLWHNATSVTIVNNTVALSQMGILVGSGDYYNGFAGPDDYTFVANNIVYGNVYGISEEGNTGIHNVYTNNLVFANSSYEYSLQNGLKPSYTVNGDPLFVNGGADFHLTAGSPAIAAASSSNAPSSDLDGNPRPTPGGGYDIGAYQYVPGF
jgi:hypothetical protein